MKTKKYVYSYILKLILLINKLSRYQYNKILVNVSFHFYFHYVPTTTALLEISLNYLNKTTFTNFMNASL